MQALQKEREDKLAATLKNKLEPFVEGRTDEFTEWANQEAKSLSSAGKRRPFIAFFFIYRIKFFVLFLIISKFSQKKKE